MRKHRALAWFLFVLITQCSTAPQRSTVSLDDGTVGFQADQKAFEEHGYTHASLRFLQMDVMRRAVSGRLAELFGPGKEENDRRSFSLGLPQILPQMKAKLARNHPDVYALLEAYTRGVNRFLAELAQSPEGTSRHALLGLYRAQITQDGAYLPARWDVQDSLAANLTLSFGLTNALEETLALGAVFRKLYIERGKPEAFVDFFDARPIEPFTPLPRKKKAEVPSKTSVVWDAWASALPQAFRCPDLDFPSGCHFRTPGSNTWAIAAKLLDPKLKSAAILATDPHLPMQNPSFYIETQINSRKGGGQFNVTGQSIPGIAGIAIGHNEKMAWGVTNAMAHVDQVYIETLSSDGSKVKFKDGWVPLVSDTYSISVREPKGVLRQETIVVRSVPHHGVLFSPLWPELKDLPAGSALSYRWAGFEDGGVIDYVGSFLLNRATNHDEFKKAVWMHWTGAGNYLYADTSGEIAYAQHGLYPTRSGISAAVPPYIPLPGDGAFEWTGFRTEFPEAHNPASGYLVVVNDDPWGRNLGKHFNEFQDYFTFKSTEGCRGKRIRDLIEAKKKITVADVMKMQFDHKDLLASRLVNEILKPMERKGALANLEAGRILVSWNGQMSKERKEPLVYASWLYVMMARHFEATIPLGVFPQLGETPAGVQTLYHQLTALWEKQPAVATRWVQASLAETEAKMRATKRWGKTWGSDHHLTLKSPLGMPPTVGPERDGSWLTVDVGGYQGVAKMDGSLPDTFSNTYGANFRMISQLQNSGEIKTLAVLPGGVEGDDQRFSEGKYREVAPLVVVEPPALGIKRSRN